MREPLDPIPLASPLAGVFGLSGVFVSVVRLETSLDERLLTDQELAIFATLPTERRKREWWAGRIASRSVLRACGAGAASVLADERGAPVAVGPHASAVRVAISHGRRSAAAAATRTDEAWPHVGIDLVDPEDLPRVRRLAERVLTPEERALAETDESVYLLAWAAREAVAKATRTGMFVYALRAVWLQDVSPLDGRLFVNLPGLRIHSWKLETGETLVIAGASEEAFQAGQAAAGLGTATTPKL